MSSSSVGPIGQQGQQATTSDAFQGVNMDDFVKLLIAQLQHQDPLEPMNNQEILNQITQIREIESNQRLTDTLESVLLGQSMATAGNMLGRTIAGLADGGERVTGEVDRVSLENGVAKLHVGEKTILLTNVGEIVSEEPQ